MTPPLQLVMWYLSRDEGLRESRMGSSCVPGSKPAPAFGGVILVPGVCRMTAISIRADLSALLLLRSEISARFIVQLLEDS